MGSDPIVFRVGGHRHGLDERVVIAVFMIMSGKTNDRHA